MYEFTDLGWRALDAQGKTTGPKKEGFVWHTDPGCVLLPEDTRICFIRCDEFECVKKEVCASGSHEPYQQLYLMHGFASFS